MARPAQGMGGGGQCDLKPEQTAWRFCGSSSAPLSLDAGSLWAGVLLGHPASSSAGPYLLINRDILKVMTSPLCGPRNLAFSGKCCEGPQRRPSPLLVKVWPRIEDGPVLPYSTG